MKDRAAAVAARSPEPHSRSAGYGRPQAIEDASNRIFIHPLAERVARAALAHGVSANVLSFLGLGCGIVAAVLYGFLPQPLFVLGAFAAMIGWHVLDGADGKVARGSGTASAFGRILDGICDHLVFGAVYFALAARMMEGGSPAWVPVLAIAAALSHALQAAAYEERRQKYERRRTGRSRDAVQRDLLVVGGARSFLAGLYDRGQRLLSGPDSGLDRALARLGDGPDAAARVAEIVDRTVPMVRAWSILNANNRTVLITVFALLGQPGFYFLLEITLFNLALVVLMGLELRLERKLARRAEDAAAGGTV